jgi:hypothetical protein
MNHTIAEIDPTKAAAYEAMVIDLAKTEYPQLDLRVGTGLRDLLIRPDASLLGVASMDNTALQEQMSLALMTDDSDPDIVAAVASNLGVDRREGVQAAGSVMVETTIDQRYYITANMYFTAGSLRYNVLQAWETLPTTYSGTVDNTRQVRMNVGAPATQSSPQKYYFILPLQAAAVGVASNILAGTALTPGIVIGSGFTAATVYADIYGGEDAETVTQFKDRVPQAIGIRTMESFGAISAKLMEQFPEVRDVSVIGMGEEELLRDRHNVFGVSAGGKIDVYVRTSSQPETVSLLKTGYRQNDGSYKITIEADPVTNVFDAPGMYMVRGVTAPTLPLTAEQEGGYSVDGDVVMAGAPVILGSYRFTEIRRNTYTGSLLHDIQGMSEAYYTKWQGSDIYVLNSGATAAAVQFRVELYLPKRLADIQSYVDSDSVRNRNADTVIRGAIPCFVTAVAKISKSAAASPSAANMTRSLVDYINAKKIGDVLTVSQMASVMHSYDIISMGVDYQHGIQLQGTVLGTDGLFYTVSGSVLDINAIKNVAVGISPRTVAFFADPINMNIEGI